MNQPKDPDVLEAAKSRQAETTGADDAGSPADDLNNVLEDVNEAPETEPPVDTEPDSEDSETSPSEPGVAILAAAPSAPEAEPPIDPVDDEHHDEAGHRSLAATALMILVGIIVVASLTLWVAPKLAPYLPAGAAKYLLPGQIGTEAEIATLRDALSAQAETAQAEAASLKAELAAAIEASRAETAQLTGRLDELSTDTTADEAMAAAEDTAAQVAALASRNEALAAEFGSLGDELSAINAALASGGDGEGATSPEISAAVAALGARLDALSSSIEDGAAVKSLEQQLAALAERVDAVESSTADARNMQTEALGEVSTAIQQASMRVAVASLTSLLRSGQPYTTPLDEIAALTGATPPEALSAGAAAGVATAATLDTSFGASAQAALAADVRAGAGEDSGSQVLGWLRSQVTGRPITEQEGDSVGATTSRIAARVREGALTAALAEAETLPEHAQDGFGQWLDQLRARVAAERALAGWLTEIGAGG